MGLGAEPVSFLQLPPPWRELRPGSIASLACTLSEHLRARPKYLCLPEEGAFFCVNFADLG